MTANPFAYDAEEPTCSECRRATHQNYDQLQECLTSLRKKNGPRTPGEASGGRLGAATDEGTQAR